LAEQNNWKRGKTRSRRTLFTAWRKEINEGIQKATRNYVHH
jgi:hypothetical protein